jgi:tetratricopeptide (TPR) repeat protein
MKLWTAGIVQRILGFSILIILLGVAPRSHEVKRGFEWARQAQGLSSPQTANQLAQIGEQLPWRSDLWEQAAISAYIFNSPKQAIEYFNHASRLSPQGQLILGDAYIQTAKPKDAIQTWEYLLEAHGQSEDALKRLSEAYLAQGNYNAAINSLKELLDLQNQIINPQFPISQTYSDLGKLLAAHNPQSAPPYLLQAAELNPQEREYLRELAFAIQRALPKNEPAFTLLEAGRQLGEHGSWGLAAHAFQQATQLRPDYAEAWAYLGEATYHIAPNVHEDALSMLEHAHTLAPESLSANTFLALYWQRQGDYQKSQAYIQIAASLDEYNITLQTYLAEISAQSGDLDTAQELYNQAIQLDPYDAMTYQSFAEFCLRYNLDTQQIALPAARQAVLLAPNDPASLDVMGQVLFRSGDYANAERFYLEALELDPQYPKAHLHLGLLYVLQQDTSLARQHLSLTITLAPGSAAAAHAQRLLDEVFGQNR